MSSVPVKYVTAHMGAVAQRLADCADDPVKTAAAGLTPSRDVVKDLFFSSGSTLVQTCRHVSPLGVFSKH